MNASQAPAEKWTRHNHLYRDGHVNEDGYAKCVNCGAHENDPRIIKLCPDGPVAASLTEVPPEGDRQQWFERARHTSHAIDLCVRHDGHSYRFAADWLKHWNPAP